MGGIHALDLLLHLLGENRQAISVSAVSSGPFRRDDFNYPPNVSALINFEGGATGRVGVSVEAEMPYVFHLQANGTKGTIRQKGVYAPDQNPDAKDFVPVSGNFPDDWNVASHPFAEEIGDFIDSIRSGSPNGLDFRYAGKTYELLFAIEEAAQSGETLRLGQGKGQFCLPY